MKFVIEVDLEEAANQPAAGAFKAAMAMSEALLDSLKKNANIDLRDMFDHVPDEHMTIYLAEGAAAPEAGFDASDFPELRDATIGLRAFVSRENFDTRPLSLHQRIAGFKSAADTSHPVVAAYSPNTIENDVERREL